MRESRTSIRSQLKSLSELGSAERRIVPAPFFLLYLASLLAVSCGYMYFFCWHFGVSRRLLILHLTVVAGGLLCLVLVTGLPLLSRSVRARRLTRYAIALVYAGWSTALAALYLADFVSYRLWGHNINYQLISHYVLRRHLLDNKTLALPPQVYLVIVFGMFVIFVSHLGMSKKISQGLEEIFLPGRSSSLFRDRGRTLKLSAALGLILCAYAIFLAVLPTQLNSNWQMEYEPVTGFFRPDLYDASRDALAERLRFDEPRIRAGYPRKQNFERKNVVIIIVDSLRADHMQIYGYDRPTTPFLNSLLQSGKLKKVELATATCAESNCGILSTLSSRNLHGIIPEDFKLHDLLHDQGYGTYFILSGDHEWYGLKQAYGKDLTYYFDGASSKSYPDMLDDRLLFEGMENVPDFAGKPAFFYFHLMSVHFSGIKQDRYRIYQPSTVERNWEMLMQGKYNVTSLVNNYDNGIIQADAMIQQIFDSLQEKGYLADSLVVILADHGEGLGERDEKDFGHVNSLYQEFIRIPLLFYDSSQTTYTNLKYATQIDVAPTILARLGLLVPSSWQGQSLLSPDNRPYSFHQTKLVNPAYAIVFRTDGFTYKYLYRTQDRREELYDLNNDPGETKNLMLSADQSLIMQLRAKLAEYLSQS